jgi:hypothetical protein
MGYYEERLKSLSNRITKLIDQRKVNIIIIAHIKKAVNDMHKEFGNNIEIYKHIKKMLDLLKGIK